MTTPAGPDSDTAQLVTALKENANRLGLTWDLRMATVNVGADPGNVFATFDNADTGALPTQGIVSMIGAVSPGARVYIISTGDGTSYITGYGAAGSAQMATVNVHMLGGGPTQTRATNVFLQILGPGSVPFQVTINKKFAATALRIDTQGSFYSTGSASQPLFGVQILGAVSGPDTGAGGLALASHWPGFLGISNASLNNHTPWAGSIILPGVSAGAAIVSLWWQRNGGAGTLTMDNNDVAFMTVSEVWPS